MHSCYLLVFVLQIAYVKHTTEGEIRSFFYEFIRTNFAITFLQYVIFMDRNDIPLSMGIFVLKLNYGFDSPMHDSHVIFYTKF